MAADLGKRFIVIAVLLAGLAAGVVTVSPAAHANGYGGSRAGNAALNWAETHALGHPYVYGGAGPYGFDCSGTVYAAFRAEGIWLPRTTYAMLGSARLHRIPLSAARRGDLLFFGSGHVEFDTVWSHVSFGAQHSGTLVGWHRWSGYYAPTMAFRVY